MSQPEQFYCDPHYNERGEAVKYTIGGILQIEYTYDDNKRPVKKNLYVGDTYDGSWGLNAETSYSYSEDRLTEVNVMAKKGSFSLMDSVYNIVYSHNDKKNIDTLRVSSADASTHNGIIRPISDKIIVNYLNRWGQPDSSYTFYANISNEKPLKTFYTYDKQGRCTKSEIFASDWNGYEKVGWLTVKYDKNKTTYSQTDIHTRFKENFVEGEDPEEDYEVNYLYEIAYDDKGRITHQYFRRGDMVMLEAHLSYDSRGRTIVDKRRIEIPEAIQRHVDLVEYTIGYEGDHQLAAYYIRKEDEKNTIKTRETDIIYNAANLPETVIVTRYDDDDGLFNEANRFEYKYNEKGQLTNEATFRKNEPDGVFENHTREIYDYDIYGNIIKEEKYYHYPEGWKGEEYKLYEYDDKKRLIYTESFEWEYATANHKGKWGNNYKTYAEYDNNGRITLLKNYNWDKWDKKWRGHTSYSKVFDQAGNMIEKTVYKWNRENGQWTNDTKSEYENVGNSKKSTRFQWLSKGETWQPVRSTQVIEESENNKESIVSEWDRDANRLLITSHEKWYVVDDSLKVEEKFYQDYDTKELKASRKYIGFTRKYEDSTLRHLDVTYTWHDQKKDWVGKSKYLRWYDGKVKKEASARYDSITGSWVNKKMLFDERTMYIWKDDKWLPYKKEEIEYDNDYNRTHYISLWNWQEEDWKRYHYYQKSPDGNYTYYYSIDNETGIWLLKFRRKLRDFYADGEYYNEATGEWSTDRVGATINYGKLVHFSVD
ncbi:DUF3836 domain-containing protein [Dysgonomonas sp. 511]|uniref:DUF3836 domain-containing protein n=1 Tax=Dysgonomonas sp. 511 TaxID=2302930 RepID=UPI0013D37FE1|nr:DUF3836 domain-containing protein [Dysgonomonas sp. 511]NDV79147.1 hypothetical protein [Dysgonomonas sp. 511]